ncbi:hypothetical protein [Nocardia brasiliensis]|uniref:hypothetical protein n=1 Tax=Nocardia brasiliensis TaxID=37326 RepID=UPI002455BE4B|nr:hypothetical protein [Nocardia brasiliensis]
MNEILTARLDESYTQMDTGVRIQRIRLVQFLVVPARECLHLGGTICGECADVWQYDYTFNDPFPFERIAHRPTISDLIQTGKLKEGDSLGPPDRTRTSAVVTHNGLMLADGRIYTNPSAAANAIEVESEEPPHDEHAETETCQMWPDLWDVQQLSTPTTSLPADHVILIAVTANDRRHAAARAITWIQDHTPAEQDWNALTLDQIAHHRWTVALTTPEDTIPGPTDQATGDLS